MHLERKVAKNHSVDPAGADERETRAKCISASDTVSQCLDTNGETCLILIRSRGQSFKLKSTESCLSSTADDAIAYENRR